MSFDSRRLHFRQLDESDVSERYVTWLNDPEVTRFLETRHTRHERMDCVAFVNACNAAADSRLYGIFERGSGQHIGNIKIGAINPHYQSGQVSLLIGEKSCWGKGYGPESIEAISRHAFKVLDLKKLEAGCYLENLASLRAFLNSGYRIEGVLHDSVVLEGRRTHILLLGARESDIRDPTTN